MSDRVCPNKCGKLTILMKPISILYVTPVELLEEFYEGHDTPEDLFGYIIAVCDKCGFFLGTEAKEDAFDPVYEKIVLPAPIGTINRSCKENDN